jgi:pimeloyl-ACP methyl ester carboxylesterase
LNTNPILEHDAMTGAPDLGLLLLHALPLDGRMWSKQLDIAPGKTLTPDLYEFGNRIQDWASSCIELIPYEKLVIVGCSVGGSCALEVMRLAPDRVAGAVLIGTKARHDPDPDALSEVQKTVENHGVAGAWERYWKPLFEQNADGAVVQIAQEIALAQSDIALISGLKSFFTRESREDVVRESTVPIQIVTGDQDQLPGIDYSRRLAKLSKSAQLHIFENCGHYVPMMQPTKLNRLIADTIAVASCHN